jgi:putative endonuclease
MYTVYVLYSEKSEKHYTGFTSDFENRLLSHNELGKKDWSNRFRPWKVILKEEYQEKSEAMKREKWLKTGSGRDYVKTLLH